MSDTKIVKQLKEEVAQNRRDLDRYQAQWADYEKCRKDNNDLKVGMRLQQDYIFMLLDCLRDARHLQFRALDVLVDRG